MHIPRTIDNLEQTLGPWSDASTEPSPFSSQNTETQMTWTKSNGSVLLTRQRKNTMCPEESTLKLGIFVVNNKRFRVVSAHQSSGKILDLLPKLHLWQCPSQTSPWITDACLYFMSMLSCCLMNPASTFFHDSYFAVKEFLPMLSTQILYESENILPCVCFQSLSNSSSKERAGRI